MATLIQPSLSRAEWHAVSIAFNDAANYCAGMRKPGWLGRFFTLLTGIEPKHPLADPRLEAIRRFVMTVRRKPEAITTLMPELEAQGFSHAQAEALAIIAR